MNNEKCSCSECTSYGYSTCVCSKSEPDPLEAAAEEYAAEHTRLCAAQMLPGSFIDGFKAGAAWAYANPKVSGLMDANAMMRAHQANDRPAPQVSVEDEAEAEFEKLAKEELRQDLQPEHLEEVRNIFRAGHVSGRRSRDAEVAHLLERAEHYRELAGVAQDSKMEQIRIYKITEAAWQQKCDKLTAELTEARAQVMSETAIYDEVVTERDALKSQLTQAQADVAELRDAIERALDRSHLRNLSKLASNPPQNSGVWDVQAILHKALECVKGRS